MTERSVMSVSAPVATIGSERTCGYSDCRQPLDYNGVGRPPEYCADRRWPAHDPHGRSCKQMAAEDRAAHRAAGLEAALSNYRASTELFMPAAEALVSRLAGLVEATAGVQHGALARIADTEAAMVAAIQRAERAADDPAQARRDTTAAAAARDQALEDRNRAQESARETRVAADEQVRGALADLAEAQRLRGHAEADAAGARAAAASAQQTLIAATRDVQTAVDAAGALRAELASAANTIVELKRRAEHAEASVTHLRERLAADEENHVAHMRTANARIAALVDERDRLHAANDGLRCTSEAARTDMAAAQAAAQLATMEAAAAAGRADRAEARESIAERRRDELIAMLASNARTATPNGPI